MPDPWHCAHVSNANQTYLKFFQSADLGELVSGVTKDRRYPPAIVIRIDEGGSVDAIAALPTDGERGIGFLDVDRFALAVSSQSCREPVGGVEQPGIAGFSWPTVTMRPC